MSESVTDHPALPGPIAVELCSLGISAGELRHLLGRVTRLVVMAIPAADAVSILLGPPCEPELVVTSSPQAQAGDGIQHLAGGGPTFDAHQYKRCSSSGDLADDPRLRPPGGDWDTLAVRSCQAFPLELDDAADGVMTLYSRTVGAFGGDTILEQVRPFAVAAQTLVRDARMLTRTTKERDQLHEALRHRAVIEQAKGMIMMSRGCDADQAFRLLVRMSNVRNTKLRAIAHEFVTHRGRLQR